MAVYGVATNNPFALLGGDGQNDDDDVERLAENAAAKQKTTVQETTPSGTRGTRGGSRGRGVQRGGRRSEGPTRDTAYETEYVRSADVRGGRGPRGRGRGGSQGRGKRQYDRRDGTGRGHEYEKRHGGGKGNWGVEGEWVEQPPPAEETPPEEPPRDGHPADGETKDEATVEEAVADGEKKEEPVKVEEKPVFTLEEYEKMLQEKATPLMTQTKKEAPAVDKRQFDGMAMLKKSQAESGFESLEVERSRRRKERREKDVETVEVAFRVGEPVRRGRGRGRGRSRDFDGDVGRGWPTEGEAPRHEGSYRGRGRGRSYRGRAYEGREESRRIDMNSENVFPSLTG